MDPVLAVVVVLTCTILAGCLAFVVRQNGRAEAAWSAERERLIQLVAARDGREFAVIRKASEPKVKPEERDEEPSDLVGGVSW